LETEREYIIRTFEENYKKYKDKNIFIYGVGYNTKTIVEHFTDYNILGVLDGTRHDEYIYGKYIYNLPDIVALNPDVIVIIARKTNVKFITRRISKFCIDNNIKLADVFGNDLLVEKSNKKENPYFNLNESSLKDEIEKHDVISFDIFDTLIMRRVLLPQDVFDIVANTSNLPFNFKKERIKAEQELNLVCVPNLEQIYKRISENNAGIDLKVVLQKEIDVEKKLLIRREKMVEIFNYAISLEKDVYLISDMYLNKHQLISILDGLNIKGYKDIFISCEYDATKDTNLFEIYKGKISGNSYLHIGDNISADKEKAIEYGIDAFLIKSAYELVEISLLEEVLNYTQDFNSRLHIGLLLSNIFNNPFALYNSAGLPHIKDCNQLAMFIAPFAVDFALWLIGSLRVDGCKNVLLAARDGFIFNKIFDAIDLKDINYRYLLTSRRFSILCCIKNTTDIMNIVRVPFASSADAMLKDRFVLETTDIYDEEKHGAIEKYVLLYGEQIIKQSADMCNNYKAYLETLGLDLTQKTAFFDFVSTGTTQLYFNSLLPQKLFGYYCIRIIDDSPSKQALDIRSMQQQGNAYELKSNLYNKYMFLESIFTSDKPTLKTFNENCEPEYSVEYRNEEEIDVVLKMQDAIVEYSKIFYEFCDKNAVNKPTAVSDILLGLLDVSKVSFESDVLDRFQLKDEFNGTTYEANGLLES